MAAASTVVDLCALADAKLDAATSAKFFRDDDGAGGAISSCSWPEAERTTSKLISQSALQELCEKYKVPAGYTPTTLDGRWVACRPPPEGSNIVFVYADALEAGIRIPLHKFYVAVLKRRRADEVAKLQDDWDDEWCVPDRATHELRDEFCLCCGGGACLMKGCVKLCELGISTEPCIKLGLSLYPAVRYMWTRIVD